MTRRHVTGLAKMELCRATLEAPPPFPGRVPASPSSKEDNPVDETLTPVENAVVTVFGKTDGQSFSTEVPAA